MPCLPLEKRVQLLHRLCGRVRQRNTVGTGKSPDEVSNIERFHLKEVEPVAVDDQAAAILERELQ